MVILAIDTATRRGSVALLDGERVVGASWLDDTHGSALAPGVAALLAPLGHGAASRGLAAVEGVALAIGPGSFTGLRIGLAFVKGLALARPLPTIPVSTLELIAEGAGGSEVLAVIDARNRELFARGSGLAGDGLYRVEALVEALAARGGGRIAGELPAGLLALLPQWEEAAGPTDPPAITLARLAAPRLAAGEGRDPASLQPSYGQPAAVDRPRHGVDTLASQT